MAPLLALSMAVLCGFSALALNTAQDSGTRLYNQTVAQAATSTAAQVWSTEVAALPVGSGFDRSSTGVAMRAQEVADVSGITTNQNDYCETNSGTQFDEIWWDTVPTGTNGGTYNGTCSAPATWKYSVEIQIPPLPASSIPSTCSPTYDCLQVLTNQKMANILGGTLGIPTTTVNVSDIGTSGGTSGSNGGVVDSFGYGNTAQADGIGTTTGNGQLGQPDTPAQHNSPVSVSGLSNVTQVAAGGFFSTALDAGGNVWAQGDNNSGELALGGSSGIITEVGAGGSNMVCNSSPCGSVTVTFPASTAHDLLVAQVGHDSTWGSLYMTNAGGWIPAVQYWHSGGEVEIWYYPDAPAGVTSATFSNSYAGGVENPFAAVTEWAGVATASPLDQTGTGLCTTNGTSCSALSTSGAVSTSGELGVSNWGASGTPASMSPNTAGWSQTYTYASIDGFSGDADSSLGSGTISESEKGSSTTQPWVGVIATFKPAPAVANYDANTHATPAEISGLSNVTQIVAATKTAYALDSTGNVWAWGDNTYGELGNGTTSSTGCNCVSVPETVCVTYGTSCTAYLSNIVQIATGRTSNTDGYSGYALRADGTVWAWGNNTYGQLGNNSTTSSPVAVEVLTGASGCATDLCNVSSIGAGAADGYAIIGGTLYSWGDNKYGELGNGNHTLPSTCGATACAKTPVAVSGVTTAKAVYGGGYFAYALLVTGAVDSWGDSNAARFDLYSLGNGSGSEVDTPGAVSTISNVTSISAGSGSGYAIEADGSVWAWGNNGHGEEGQGNNSTTYSSPVKVSTLANARMVAAGYDFALAALGSSSSSNGVYSAGYGDSMKNACTAAACQSAHWGGTQQGNGQLGQADTPANHTSLTSVGGLSTIVSVVGTNGSVMALDSGGNVWTWGDNTEGQLGNGSMDALTHTTPAKVSSLNGTIVQIAASSWTMYALDYAGHVWAWGDNLDDWQYALGNGTTSANNATPGKVCVTYGASCTAYLSNIKQIAVGKTLFQDDGGGGHALRADGTAWGWGEDDYADLGRGTYTNANCSSSANACGQPLAYEACTVYSSGCTTYLTNVSSIGAGADTGYGIVAGQVYSWGFNDEGEIGNGTTKTSGCQCSKLATLASTITTAKALSSGGGYFIFALLANGTVDSWGSENQAPAGSDNGPYSQDSMGNGTTTTSEAAPVAVSTISNVYAISGGTDAGYAIEANGSIWGWGNNTYGELGQGNTTGASSPVQIASMGNATAVGSGYDATYVLGGTVVTTSPGVIG